MSPGPKKRRNLLHTLRRLEIDLVYSNTITNGEVLEWLEPLRLPVLTHVHEMSHWIERCGQKNFELVKKNSIFYVAASKAVKEELHEHWGIAPDQIEVVYEFIPTDTRVPSEQVREEVRRLLAVPKHSFLVVGSGVETWRKGKDIFVDLALEIYREQPLSCARFLWVGAWENREHEMELQARIRSESLQGRVMFIGQVDNPLDYFSAADVFAMTSREDPYPLVCLEAALMGLPVLCFENAGGMPEFVEQDAGMIFPYLDVAAMAKGIVELSMSLEKKQMLGDAARAKVKSRHDVTVGGSQLHNVITGLLNSLSAV
jgi:glycosyltransferase involved in cell wall biosynthesis